MQHQKAQIAMFEKSRQPPAAAEAVAMLVPGETALAMGVRVLVSE
jgi:hypothetical protein